MRFDIVTIFPGFFSGIFEHGIVRRAQAGEQVTIAVHDLRNFTHDRHRTVDDRPFGGGEGMVLKLEPLAEAMAELGIAAKCMKAGTDSSASAARADFAQDDSVRGDAAETYPTHDKRSETRIILLSPQGRRFDQAQARELAALNRLVLICGRYEGVDERFSEHYCDAELSIGDYVLSGGELAAAVIIDAVARLIPGVLGNEASSEFESFGAPDAEIAASQPGVPRSQHGAGGLLDYPHYTRPAEFAGLRVPEVLVNGDHRQIRRWRREQQLSKTLRNRPDLLETAALSAEDRQMLDAIRARKS